MAVDQLADSAWWGVTGEGKLSEGGGGGSGWSRPPSLFWHGGHWVLRPYREDWHRCRATALQGLPGQAFPSDEMPNLTSPHPSIPALSLPWHQFTLSFPTNLNPEMSFVLFVPVRTLINFSPVLIFGFVSTEEYGPPPPPNKSSLCVIIFRWQNVVKLIRVLEGSFSQIVNCRPWNSSGIHPTWQPFDVSI